MLNRIHAALAVIISLLITAPAHALWTFDRPLENTQALLSSWSSNEATYVVGLKGKAFRHDGSSWTSISTPTIESANLFCIFGTSDTNIYAGGYRLGPPRFDTNGDNTVDEYDDKSRYGVIFRYDGSIWDELRPGYPEDSPFFASSYASIWSDGEHAVYIAGGKQISGNTSEPMGVCLKLSGNSFTPVMGIATPIPQEENPTVVTTPTTINGIWGTPDTLYFACSQGVILKMNRANNTLETMKGIANSVEFRAIWADGEGANQKLYAVGAATIGYIFTHHSEHGWIPMGLDNVQPQPFNAISGKPGLIMASGSYAKAYVLDQDESSESYGVWKEVLSGTSNHINHMHRKGDELIAVASTGETYRIKNNTQDTCYILPTPQTGIGTVNDKILQLDATLTDFSLGSIWKRVWVFGNDDFQEPVPASGYIFSKTSGQVDTKLTVTTTGGAAANGEFRIIHCTDCSPGFIREDNIYKLTIHSGSTSQQKMKEILEASSLISEVTIQHPTEAWIVQGNHNYDSFDLTNGRDNENIYENTITTGEASYTATHTYKSKETIIDKEGEERFVAQTFTAELTVYRENTGYLGSNIFLLGTHEPSHEGIKVQVHAKDITTLPRKGVLGGLISITAQAPHNILPVPVILFTHADAATTTFESTYALTGDIDRPLILIIPQETTGKAIVDYLNKAGTEASRIVASAEFIDTNPRDIEETERWSYGNTATLCQGSQSALGLLGGGIIGLIAPSGAEGTIDVQLQENPDATQITSSYQSSTLSIVIKPDTTVQQIIDYINEPENTPASDVLEKAFFIADNRRAPTTDIENTATWSLEEFGESASLQGGANYIEAGWTPASKKVDVYIEDKKTLSTDIARELSALKDSSGSGDPVNLFQTSELIIGRPWDTTDPTLKQSTTMPGISEATASYDVKLFPSTDFDFTYTPTSTRGPGRITFNDASSDALDIKTWEWAIFRQLTSGEFETKASIKSTDGTGHVDLTDLGTYSIGLKATLKDGSVVTMQKDDAVTVKGEDAGKHSIDGANGCFIGTVR